jgi:hypothetical protein
MRTVMAEPVPVQLCIHAEHKTPKRGTKYDKYTERSATGLCGRDANNGPLIKRM